MTICIEIKLFASLTKFLPESADKYEIKPGETVRNLLTQLRIPEKDAKLIFIDGIRSDMDTALKGGERVGIFPPVGGG